MSVVVLVASALGALVLAFVARTRLPAPLLIALLALCGAGIGLGAAAVELDTIVGPYGRDREIQRWVAVGALAVLTPLHVRVVLGPLGRKG